MNFHPDVLAAHAQFGGDLESMQALYDRPDHVAEIARLQEQMETLTRERDDAIASVKLISAQHRQQMTHDGKLIETAEAERDRLREIILRAADQCDKWVKETYDGSWSTHQAQSQRALAKSLRLAALQKEPCS